MRSDISSSTRRHYLHTGAHTHTHTVSGDINTIESPHATSAVLGLILGFINNLQPFEFNRWALLRRVLCFVSKCDAILLLLGTAGFGPFSAWSSRSPTFLYGAGLTWTLRWDLSGEEWIPTNLICTLLCVVTDWISTRMLGSTSAQKMRNRLQLLKDSLILSKVHFERLSKAANHCWNQCWQWRRQRFSARGILWAVHCCGYLSSFKTSCTSVFIRDTAINRSSPNGAFGAEALSSVCYRARQHNTWLLANQKPTGSELLMLPALLARPRDESVHSRKPWDVKQDHHSDLEWTTWSASAVNRLLPGGGGAAR